MGTTSDYLSIDWENSMWCHINFYFFQMYFAVDIMPSFKFGPICQISQ